MKKRKKEYLLIILFVFIISTPYFIWTGVKEKININNNEKRTLAAMPSFSLQNIQKFPGLFDDFVNDHLPFRNQLSSFNSTIAYKIFKSSTNENVILGNNGWLFYKSLTDGTTMSDYKGLNILTDEQLSTIANNMITTRNNLASQGIEFVIFIVPNKERLYSHEMPSYYGRPSEEYTTFQIVKYLKDNTDIRVIYPIEQLERARNTLGENAILYHKTDTHWNELGAYIGSCELLKELGIALPQYNNKKIKILKESDTPGDLTELLNLNLKINSGKTYKIKGFDTHNITSVKDDFTTEIIYKSKKADTRKLFVYRDSFCSAMSRIIGSQFNSSYMVYSDYYNKAQVEKEKPDIFVLESVERYATGCLLNFRYE